MPQKSHSLDWLLLTALILAWGSSFAMTKVAVTHLDASWVMALRLTVAAIVLVPYAYANGQPLVKPDTPWRKFAWLGFIGHALPFFLITWGMHFVSSGVAGLLMGAIPLFIVVLAHFTLPDEQLTWTKSAGFILGFAGIIVLIGPESLTSTGFSGSELVGELAVLVGCVCYAVHAITAKRLGLEHPVKQTASVCTTGALMGLGFAGVASPGGLLDAPLSAFLAVAGLGVLPTAMASLILYKLLARSGPSFVAYSNYLIPPYAVIAGAIVLGEHLSWNIFAALALILSGIAISRMNLSSKPENAP
jgi:drug/metabolite transporter (DMT)-like permease